MRITCSKTTPPLGGILAAEYLKTNLSKSITVEWGSETKVDNNGQIISASTTNDLCRIISKLVAEKELYGANPTEKSEVDSWLTFSIGPIVSRSDFTAGLQHLNKTLGSVTFLVGKCVTIADFALFATLYVSKQWQGVISKKEAPVNVLRWYNFIKAMPSVSSTINSLPDEIKRALIPVVSSRQSVEKNTSGSRAQEGKFVDLPGAEMGKVVVRFPPEASGYLHIGHAKAALLNQYYQQAFEGKLIMRFDDTNPAKENIHFEKVILEDLEMLEIKPDLFTHTSQYFDLMLEYCEKMLKTGKAYVDDTNPELMKEQRDQRMENANRGSSVEKNFDLWKEMLKGSEKGQKCCVRAKIDMTSPNGCMRDPTIYRCKNEPHPRTGTSYKVYPTYDFACPIVDAIEGVTHTLRTMEYHDRDAQFYWFIDALDLRKPYIWEYSRLSMTNTVLSKRKLTWFVQENLVDGWDDPRMPTVRGVLRRGMTVEGLKQFIIAQGSSRSVVFMEWDKIWAFNKKVIDPIAPRYTAVDSDDPVLVHIKGAKEENTSVAAHPKNPDIGNKEVWVGPNLLIDRVDAEVLKEGENTTFINWGNLIIKKINRQNGKITTVDAETNLENKDYKKTVKLTWLAQTEKAKFTPTWCVYFDHIMSKPLLGKDEDFKQFVGHETRKEVKMLGDPELRKLKKGDIIQLQRKGFFRCDKPYKPPSKFTGVEQPVILFYIPDGHTKETPTSSATASKVQTSNKTTKDTKQEPTRSAGARTGIQINADIVKQGDIVRELKSKKAGKADIDAAIKQLLDLKTEYKNITNSDWKPGCVAPTDDTAAASGGSGDGDINVKIAAQGDKVRQLKSEKADKATIDEAVKGLLALKAEFKQKTGHDWKPIAAPAPTTTAAPSLNAPSNANSILEKIAAQGEKVRDCKVKKADKGTVDGEVKILLALKSEYKAATGQDWKPGMVATSTAQVAPASNILNDENDILNKIAAQGEKVRDCKAKKADKATVDGEVKMLLALKSEYKAATGHDWKPGMVATSTQVAPPSNDENDILNKIAAQGEKVRDCKAKKADKATVDSEVKNLLSLKSEYKAATGHDWKPGMVATSTPQIAPPSNILNDENDILNKIAAQGEKVRDCKAKKADKATVDAEVKILLALKTEFKSATGKEWKPGMVATSTSQVSANIQDTFVSQADTSTSESSILEKIAAQGEIVRNCKTNKADKATVDAAVKVLLELKAEFKALTSKDWKPGMITPTKIDSSKVEVSKTTSSGGDENCLLNDISKQGEKVRQLKGDKADKTTVDTEIKKLLSLKADFKTCTGKDWKPGMQATSTPSLAEPAGGDSAKEAITTKINAQAETVRNLKNNKAPKEFVDGAVKMLLELKAEFKTLTGSDFPVAGRTPSKAKEVKPKESKEKVAKQKQAVEVEDGGAKKQTRLGLEAKKEENLSDWYSQVITKGEMIEYYDVSGCYIFRPWSFAIWESIKDWFDLEIKKLGVQNCYFPIFVSKSVLEKEKTHIADFAPEVAWVTKSGDSDMAEPIAVRPTSETVMYPAYAKWIQSYRDLPIKLNQWNNVVRWEFKHPQPFLRTREFLWQEGHTAYANADEAKDEVKIILDLYAQVYTDLLAIPVIKGRKTEKEKFAGGDYTYTVEAFVSASGRAIQGATSHHLGQNFSKMFDIIYEDPETQEKKYVYQNSWGITTRTIGVMIMIHADNQGLVLPPKVASVQIVIVPCGITANLSETHRKELQTSCDALENELKQAGIRTKGDYRDNYSPGWKFNHWELKGVPIRVELGPKDIKNKQLVAVRRDTGEKIIIKRETAKTDLNALLDSIQQNLYNNALKDLTSHTITLTDWSQFGSNLDKKNVILSPFCGDSGCEDKIKADSARDDSECVEPGAPSMGAKSLCIPLEQPAQIKTSDKCIHPDCKLKPKFYTLFGRSY